jgi:hypothetical protein
MKTHQYDPRQGMSAQGPSSSYPSDKDAKRVAISAGGLEGGESAVDMRAYDQTEETKAYTIS